METQNKRIFQILELLNGEKKIWDGASIAARIGVSSRTIRNDIKECNALCRNEGAAIYSETGVGYRLQVDDPERYQAFKNRQVNENRRDRLVNHIIPSNPNDRISFIIAELLMNSLHQKIITESEMADKLYISLSTLKKYLKDIKKSLKRFGLEIMADRLNGIRIQGDEAQIRYCISEYIFNSNDLLDLAQNEFYCDIFSTEEIEKVKKILLQIILKYDIHLTDIAFKNLLVHVIITLKRADSKNTTEYSKMEMKTLEQSIYFSVAQEIITIISSQMNIDIENEVYYLTQHFISSKKLMENEKNTQIKKEYRDLIDSILIKIQIDIGVDLSADTELISGLMIHLGAAVSRLKFNMNIRNEILVPVKKNYPLAFEMAVIASKVLAKKENLRTNENEMGFLAIHFGAALERRKCNVPTAKTAIIVCGTGLSTAMLVKSRLQRKFGKQLRVVKISPLYEITEELVNSVDFVFTTVPIQAISSAKIVFVESILTEQDLGRIEAVITDDTRKLDMQQEKFFRKDLFFPRLKGNSKIDVLEKLTDVMVTKGYMNQAGKKSVFDRENMSSTELGNLVAIPHALESHNDEAVISVAILDKAILWDKEKVQVVFLLSIPKSKSKIWEPVFEKVDRYFISDFGVNTLIKNPKFEVLIEKLEQ
ncbi:lichenan operon transcriptional antiterminator [Propionispira arboris]|uniref:Lichenan operon transcriptional antiterminator n=1 Tax=Propionispira arboris TaxID=84035 RepID=A0A1H6TNJ9_9FIRM|nr:BglG family transcription antiterminator [Propionispira arboris]SEI81581.1 lichenan operon transcriptional antiterminator [Propionispira arboris]